MVECIYYTPVFTISSVKYVLALLFHKCSVFVLKVSFCDRSSFCCLYILYTNCSSISVLHWAVQPTCKTC